MKELATNRKARHEYEILETIEAGISLLGSEVKSAREGRISLKDSYVKFEGGEAFLVGCHISQYPAAGPFQHDPERPRKLLLKKKEMERLAGKVQQKGLTVIPLSVYLKGNWIKVKLALAKGLKLHDRREKLKRKVLERETRQAFKDSW